MEIICNQRVQFQLAVIESWFLIFTAPTCRHNFTTFVAKLIRPSRLSEEAAALFRYRKKNGIT
jgi:hypothetical protein